MAADKQGRVYARISQLKPGDVVIVDGDFTCMAAWSQHTVMRDDAGELYIGCAEDQHGLDGQLMDDRDSLIGIYPVGIWLGVPRRSRRSSTRAE